MTLFKKGRKEMIDVYKVNTRVAYRLISTLKKLNLSTNPGLDGRTNEDNIVRLWRFGTNHGK